MENNKMETNVLMQISGRDDWWGKGSESIKASLNNDKIYEVFRGINPSTGTPMDEMKISGKDFKEIVDRDYNGNYQQFQCYISY